MGKYSKRKRSRSRSKRKRRGGTVFDSLTQAGDKAANAAKDLGSGVTGHVTTAVKGVTDEGSKFSKNIVGEGKGAFSSVEQGVGTGFASAEHGIKGVGQSVGLRGGRGRGGSGKCCFPAKFCGSRKRKGNKRRSIKSGRCCIPVKSKKCGAKKRNGRKTRKNKRKKGRGTFNMFGGG
jgi:hypothetical protein